MNSQYRLAYHAIKEVSQNNHGTITKFLAVVGVSRQAYYKGLHRDVTDWGIRDKFLSERVQYWYDQHGQSIGSTKILSNLRRDPEVTESVTLKQVKRIMNKLGIRCQVRQKKRSRIQQQYLQDNVLDQQFNASRPNQAWLADSTELVYGVNGQYKVRLSGMLDLYGRHLISFWHSMKLHAVCHGQERHMITHQWNVGGMNLRYAG